MRIYPPSLEIGENEGFDTRKDIFGRAKFGAGMTHLMDVVKDPMVIALDGQWGAGKSTFLKMWAGELRNAGHPVIYFDAFENDYLDDAFAAITRELVELIDEKTPQKVKEGRAFVEKIADMGAVVGAGVANLAMKAGVRAVTGGILSAGDLGELHSDVTKEVEKIGENYLKKIIEKPKKQKETIVAFKEALSKLPELLKEKKSVEPAKPLVFIIDELDRCKPHFALEIIERIKHFFSVPGINFVFGVHLEQLENSVRFAYGNSINANLYLQKFINLTVQLPIQNDKRYSPDLDRYAEYLVNLLNINKNRRTSVQIATMVRIVKENGMGFRTIERAFTIYTIALAMAPENNDHVGAFVGGLVMMKLIRSDLYKKALSGDLNLKEAMDFLCFHKIEKDTERTAWEKSWWTVALAEEIPDNLRNFAGGLVDDHERRELIRNAAIYIVDRLSPND
ncbi:KAP family P-loop NTPase fold protein [Brucella pseudogrignonensis]|uniref:KAP family P-loop NTPase fold protein n=1 Tax=Brucella pseudogrignonensis TaxID=419475 RepID=UPI003D97031D